MATVEIRHQNRAAGIYGINARALAEGDLHLLDAHCHFVRRADHSSRPGVTDKGYTRSGDIQHLDAEFRDPLRLLGSRPRGLVK